MKHERFPTPSTDKAAMIAFAEALARLAATRDIADARKDRFGANLNLRPLLKP